jgi:tellurite resistance protein TerC
MLTLAATSRSDFASFEVPLWIWGVFVAFVSVLLLADLLIVHRTAHVITVREALIESAVWIAIGLSFTLLMIWWHGSQAGGEYIAGYLIEKSLSVDNVFVWAVIFQYFRVPPQFQFRVLFWGIFGALVLRAIFIFAGVALIETFEWVLYVFGAFLLFTAFRIARHQETEIHPENNPVLKLVKKMIPSTHEYDGQRLFTVKNGARLATPLFAVLIMIEATDVVFAVDSVPAILAVSREPFIVFSSNAFAILGLRALYFALAGMADRFRYLNIGLGVILGFVGIKMLIAEWYHVPIPLSLGIIGTTLTVAIAASLLVERKEGKNGASPSEPAAGAAVDPEPVREPEPDAETAEPLPGQDAETAESLRDA